MLFFRRVIERAKRANLFHTPEAIEAVENSDKPEGTIVEELRKGYTLGNETLRPARVKVSMGAK